MDFPEFVLQLRKRQHHTLDLPRKLRNQPINPHEKLHEHGMENMGNNVHDSSMSKLNIHLVDAMTHLGHSETNTVHKAMDQYYQPQKIYKNTKKSIFICSSCQPNSSPPTKLKISKKDRKSITMGRTE